MASYYSADAGGPVFTQAEMCALQDAVSEAMAAGAAQGADGVGNFGNNFAEHVRVSYDFNKTKITLNIWFKYEH